MSDRSTIEWTDATWNPVTGCMKVSPGCKNCYAERFSERFRGVRGHAFEHGFDLTLHPDRLEIPLRWTRPRRIFVNSMSDLFHERIPLSFIERVVDTMERCTQHTFQVLTKRARRMLDISNGLLWPSNTWLGVSVEDAARCERIAILRECRAAARFLSIEPLLGPVAHDLDLDGIHWVIVGGESGPRSRPMDPAWVRDIRDLCVARGVPFHFKQWGGTNKKATGRILDGRTWDEFPEPRAPSPDPGRAPGTRHGPGVGRSRRHASDPDQPPVDAAHDAPYPASDDASPRLAAGRRRVGPRHERRAPGAGSAGASHRPRRPAARRPRPQVPTPLRPRCCRNADGDRDLLDRRPDLGPLGSPDDGLDGLPVRPTRLADQRSRPGIASPTTPPTEAVSRGTGGTMNRTGLAVAVALQGRIFPAAAPTPPEW